MNFYLSKLSWNLNLTAQRIHVNLITSESESRSQSCSDSMEELNCPSTSERLVYATASLSGWSRQFCGDLVTFSREGVYHEDDAEYPSVPASGRVSRPSGSVNRLQPMTSISNDTSTKLSRNRKIRHLITYNHFNCSKQTFRRYMFPLSWEIPSSVLFLAHIIQSRVKTQSHNASLWPADV